MGQLVMVIDDSLTVRKIVETSLRRNGFEAVSFPDGVEAINALTNGEVPPPDLLLLDIGLPKVDGYEIARIFKRKERFGKTIIVMLSGRDGVFDKLKGRLVGARGYITKPFKTAEVVDAVRAYLAPAP
jgi:twitching motility two-component system response regulator PilG